MRLTVQGWQNLVLAVIGTAVLACSIAATILVSQADKVSNQLRDGVQPARIAAYQLQAALRDQETAVRGYLITNDPRFLEPYNDGRGAETDAAEQIRQYLAGKDDLLADLANIEEAAEVWRSEYADPLLASVTPSQPVADASIDEGKVLFDRLRALFTVQNDHLSEARAAGLAHLDEIRGWRDAVMIAMILTFVTTAVLLAVVMRNAVTRPLSGLAAACRRITEGNFGERIIPRGPSDIRAISADVEDMRQRIVDELEISRSARAALDEQADELRRSNAELEQFAYVASHDLQEPLRKVASFCQLLEKRYGDKLDERGIEYIGYAVDGAKRMQVLINDLLTFSRVGRLNATNAEVDLNAVVDAALSNLTTTVEETGAEIVLPAAPLPNVDGDPTLLAMVWQNLIGNAVKFHRDGLAPRIAIECEEGTGEHAEKYLFTVTDNGIGIAEEFVDKVFVIFQRLHGRDSYTGTGIGLALCKKIIEHHGGTIWIDTSYTDGTRFNFTLPVIPTTAPDMVPQPQLEGTS
ncbi:histidine kinase [Mycobacterium sp. Root265]|uniref:sensor histidine kinase n=1 Tax=Mycobacterium sp. Root265 TaxID=1736504 RepID=UPI00070DE851|nr:sensor histidine kinase [Mycobacterium sp. Root265]KRD09685.1 histidine kinase [Mycobacterium sp. Root265]